LREVCDAWYATEAQMILRGLEILDPDRLDGRKRQVRVEYDRILSVAEDDPGVPGIALEEAIAFPGLINSHDHLEFNLYPPLGHRRYGDYVEWGYDIQARDRDLIQRIEDVPRSIRFAWGALKNLLTGVTRVSHHGTTRAEVPPLGPACIDRGLSLHSVQLGGGWRRRLNALENRAPYVFHVGEGTSTGAAKEVGTLLRWNLFRRELIGVHAIAMDEAQAARFSSLVWCPVSNEFLYGTTAPIARLKQRTTILFGTDSTLTADWNLWNHLRRAREIGALSDRELFLSVTRTPAEVWRVPRAGRIEADRAADIVVARKKEQSPWDAFFAIDPEDILLVMRGGRVLMKDAAIDVGDPAGCPFRIRIRDRAKDLAIDAGALIDALRARAIAANLPIERGDRAC
jgi:cytosine/adenosine deaminase-related metal-dependent hydrolase